LERLTDTGTVLESAGYQGVDGGGGVAEDNIGAGDGVGEEWIWNLLAGGYTRLPPLETVDVPLPVTGKPTMLVAGRVDVPRIPVRS